MHRRYILLLLPLVAAGSMWFYVQRVLIPHQQADALVTQRPRGNLCDLYPRWLGARELLLHGRDPYGADITREIQAGYYGRPLDPARPNDPKDQQAFAYPVYVVLILAPSVLWTFPTVHAVFFWLFVVLTASSVLLWLRALGWRLSIPGKFAWIVLTLSCFPAVQGLKLEQLTILVAALLAAAMSAVARGRFVTAGILLALATIKPQLVFLLGVWLFIWTLGNWRERQRLLWASAGTLAILVGAGELLLPGWIAKFRAALSAYYQYAGGGSSILDMVMGPAVGRYASAVVVGLFVLFAWRTRRAGEQTGEFQWSLSLALATTLLVIPMFAPYNQLLLVPAVMTIVRSAFGLWRDGRLSRFFVVITGTAVLWPWIAAALLTLALLILPGPMVQKAWSLPFYTSFAIPPTIYALLLKGRKSLCQCAAQVSGSGR